jgi:hypothetical protein
MRYRVAEKLEIIRLVEQSSLPVRRESVGNFVFVSHTKKPERTGGRYGGEQGRRNRG